MYHNIGMDTGEKRILKMLAKIGTLRSCDLKKMRVPRMALNRMIAAGALDRVSRGLYRKSHTLVSEHEDLIAIARRSPKAVFCLLSALQFHELTTQLPHEIWIAMPKGRITRPITLRPILASTHRISGRLES